MSQPIEGRESAVVTGKDTPVQNRIRVDFVIAPVICHMSTAPQFSRSLPPGPGFPRVGRAADEAPQHHRPARRVRCCLGRAAGCHTFRATGIAANLAKGSALEHAQKMTAHESPRTTKPCDRTGDKIHA
jgi:hypothetical protein